MANHLKQIKAHGCKESAAYSFCAGCGWKGHKSAEVARKSANAAANKMQREHGGGLPQHLVADANGNAI